MTTVVKLSRDDVVAVFGYVEERSKLRARQAVEAKDQKGRVARALDTANVDHYVHIGNFKGGLAASYPMRPGAVGKIFGPWVAMITLTDVGGGTEVSCELLAWTESDGVLQNSEEYLWFLDELATQLSALDPTASGHSVRGPENAGGAR